MPKNWDTNPTEMKERMMEARKAGHTRLFALAYDSRWPLELKWQHRKDEQEMQEFLDSRDRSESILFNCAIAVVVVNPNDSDETIESIIASKSPRRGTGPGYFMECF